MWSFNHIGHHSRICANTFVASHAVISGCVEIGKNSFVGVNATIGNNVVIGPECWIGLGATVVRDVEGGALLKGSRSDIDPRSTADVFLT